MPRAKDEKDGRRAGSGTRRRDRDWLVHELLSCSTRPESDTTFLTSIGKLLVAFSGCEAVQLWIRQTDRYARWEMSRSPERLYRMGDVHAAMVIPRADATEHWFDDYAQAWKAHMETVTPGSLFEDEGAVTGMRSFVLAPLATGTGHIGFVMYKHRRSPGRKAIDDLLHVSRLLAFVIVFQRLRIEQRERVKELMCLYHIGKATSESGATLDVLMRRIVDCLPPAWQYPEITRARIVLDDTAYETSCTGKERHVQASPIIVAGVERGMVQIAYCEERPDLDEGPFLREERRLIDLVASDIAQVVEQKRAEEEREALMEQVRHADRLATIGKLAAGVAHELNEPLGSILGFAQLVGSQPDLPGQVAQDIQKIEKASLYAREVIRKLMLFARQTSPTKRPTGLNQVIEDGVSLLCTRASERDIEVETRLAADLPEMTVDPGQLVQVVVNLVVNAIQAMPDGGTLVVTSGRTADHIVLTVSDTGKGMAPEVMDRIFDPFFTTKDVGEGTGLGLSVVHGIVNAHGGRIEVQSEVDGGSRFSVHLPIGGTSDGR